MSQIDLQNHLCLIPILVFSRTVSFPRKRFHHISPLLCNGRLKILYTKISMYYLVFHQFFVLLDFCECPTTESWSKTWRGSAEESGDFTSSKCGCGSPEDSTSFYRRHWQTGFMVEQNSTSTTTIRSVFFLRCMPILGVSVLFYMNNVCQEAALLSEINTTLLSETNVSA